MDSNATLPQGSRVMNIQQWFFTPGSYAHRFPMRLHISLLIKCCCVDSVISGESSLSYVLWLVFGPFHLQEEIMCHIF